MNVQKQFLQLVKQSKQHNETNMDIIMPMGTIIIFFAMIAGLIYWGRKPYKAVDMTFTGEHMVDITPVAVKRPLLPPPQYKRPYTLTDNAKRNKVLTLDGQPRSIQVIEDDVVEDYIFQPVGEDLARKGPPVSCEPQGAVRASIRLLDKFGKNALSDPMDMTKLRVFVNEMTEAGYDLKKVYPNKGEFHIAYMTFNPDR